ncbi:MAG: 3-hydroxyacyl-CoA dehydrogenase [Acidobacteriota bacterium]|nr:3-hydroxyacyl-CoA dehydrogenase [Acidobacteriota bacterium]
MSSQQTTPGFRRVAVIGAGVAGRGFTRLCLQAGLQVVLEDVMPANLRRAEQDFATMAGLELVSTVEDAVREADIAFDFVPDELESKLEIFCMIDRMAPPRTALCTPSTAQSITDLASCVYRPDRCFAVRGPLRAESTLQLLYPASASPAILAATRQLLEALSFVIDLQPDNDVPALVKNLPLPLTSTS